MADGDSLDPPCGAMRHVCRWHRQVKIPHPTVACVPEGLTYPKLWLAQWHRQVLSLPGGSPDGPGVSVGDADVVRPAWSSAGHETGQFLPSPLPDPVEPVGECCNQGCGDTCIDDDDVFVAAVSIVDRCDPDQVSPAPDDATPLIGLELEALRVDPLDGDGVLRHGDDPENKDEAAEGLALVPRLDPRRWGSTPPQQAAGDKAECDRGVDSVPDGVGVGVKGDGAVDSDGGAHPITVGIAHVFLNSHLAALTMTPPHRSQARKSPRQQRSRDTVARILASAAHLFDTNGYNATTTNHVAELAGVSIGSLYQYFPNKDALVVALADQHLSEAASVMAERLGELRSRQPAIPEIVHSLVAATVELNDSSRLHTIMFDTCPRTPALTERIDTFVDAVATEVACHLERTQTHGGDALLRARFLVVATDAAVHRVVLPIPQGPERDAAAGHLAGLIVGAVGAGHD